jgi:hypothetical protein
MKDQAHLLYGITKKSNPRKEWEERQQIDDYEKGVVGRT